MKESLKFQKSVVRCNRHYFRGGGDFVNFHPGILINNDHVYLKIIHLKKQHHLRAIKQFKNFNDERKITRDFCENPITSHLKKQIQLQSNKIK